MSIFIPGTLEPATGPVQAPSSGSGPIYGADIYHGDNVSSFAAMKAGGIDFLSIKFSEGLGTDPKHVQNYRQARAAGLIVGAYHFYNTDSSQSAQVAHFVQLLKDVGYAADDIPPCFDFEKSSGDYGSADAANCKTFLTLLKAQAGSAMVYMSDSVPGALGNPSWLSAYPWWIARYGAKPRSPYTFYQFSENASIPGLSNKGDKDIFNGSVSDLKAWISRK